MSEQDTILCQALSEGNHGKPVQSFDLCFGANGRKPLMDTDPRWCWCRCMSQSSRPSISFDVVVLKSLGWQRWAPRYLVLRCLRIAQPAFGRFFGQADRLTQSYTVLQSNMCELVEIMMRWWWPCPDVNIPNLVTIADLAWLCRFASFFHDTVWFACFILCQVRMTPAMNASTCRINSATDVDREHQTPCGFVRGSFDSPLMISCSAGCHGGVLTPAVS